MKAPSPWAEENQGVNNLELLTYRGLEKNQLEYLIGTAPPYYIYWAFGCVHITPSRTILSSVLNFVLSNVHNKTVID